MAWLVPTAPLGMTVIVTCAPASLLLMELLNYSLIKLFIWYESEACRFAIKTCFSGWNRFPGDVSFRALKEEGDSLKNHEEGCGECHRISLLAAKGLFVLVKDISTLEDITHQLMSSTFILKWVKINHINHLWLPSGSCSSAISLPKEMHVLFFRVFGVKGLPCISHAGPEPYPAVHTEAPGLGGATHPKIQRGVAAFGVPHLPPGVVAQPNRPNRFHHRGWISHWRWGGECGDNSPKGVTWGGA